MPDDPRPAAAARYAVYWVPPPGHPLWAAGCTWLGRDPSRADATPPPPPHARSPWHYGFHATLKAPLRLRPGCSAAALLHDIAALARATPAFDMPALQVAWLDRFLALRPVHEPDGTHPLRRLADRCVRELDHWRAPATADELRRHGAAARTPAQAQLLARWGYPHVLEHWRFHMTLSDTLDRRDEALERAALRHFAAALGVPLRADALAVFVQGAPGAVFGLAHRFPLAEG